MEVHKLRDMFKGWFIGNFTPTLLDTDAFEVAVKEYKAGDYEMGHYHKEAVEYTVILRGEAEMFQQRFSDGDIVCVQPNETTDFRALTDVITVVVKTPSVKKDKYLTPPES